MRPASPTFSSPPRLFLPQDATLLSPVDSYPSRGRTAPGMPPRSWSFSNDGHPSAEPGRGRSVTRNSSFSDRERSSSRTSLAGGTGSPFGSVSPTGSRDESVGNGIYSVYVQGRSGVRRVNGNAESTGSRERGRSGADRRVGVSETSSSPSRRTADEGRSLDAATADVSRSPSTLPPQQPGSPAGSISPKPTLSIPVPYASQSTTEEDRYVRVAPNTHSPSVLRHVSLAVLAPPTSAPASVLAQKPHSSTVAPSARDSLTPPGSPTEHGSFVGRASEIVSTARGLLGVLWSGSNGNNPDVP